MINHDAQFQSPSPKKYKQIIESKPNGWSPSPLKASASSNYMYNCILKMLIV